MSSGVATTSLPTHFAAPARRLHWLMAPLVIAMLFIGIGMATTVAPWRQTLLAVHRPLGIAILVLVLVRLLIRLTHRVPALPAEMPRWQRRVAHASHGLFYVLLFAMPLVGWAMLSAGGFPILLLSDVALPPIVPRDVALYALLRSAHTALALLLAATFVAHLGAALLHALVLRNSVFSSMARGDPVRSDPP